MKWTLLIFLIVGSQVVYSQTKLTTTLSGHLIDAATQKPLPFANVFINLTTHGTTTDEQGQFRLSGVPLGTIELVASYLGYETVNKTLRLIDKRPHVVNLALKRSDISLETVTVVGKRSKDWQRQYRLFKEQLLGDSPFSSQCILVNGKDVQLSESNGHLQAKLEEPLIVENLALGYRIFYQLHYFDYFRSKLIYAGNSRFEEMQSTNPQQMKRWQRNRQRAYLGSTRHLLVSMMTGKYEQEGFEVYETDFPPSMMVSDLPVISTVFRRPNLKADTLFKPGDLSFERRFRVNKVLEIYYRHRPVPNPANKAMPFARSLLTLPNGEADVTVDGWISKPQGMLLHGDLSNDRIANLLPADWKFQPTDSVKTPIHEEGVLLAADQRLDSLSSLWKTQSNRFSTTCFLHTDKATYLTGDVLWISTYWLNTSTHQLIPGKFEDIDDAMHVELLSPLGRLVEHQWVRLKGGRGNTNFVLADTLVSGVYLLRGYTEQETSHQDDFRPSFERTLTIYNPKFPPKSAFTTREQKGPIDVQFLPEGGYWVTNLPSRLGIKAVGPDGKGYPVSGRIVDAQGKEIVTFATNRLGMGRLELTPLAGQTYFALLSDSSKRKALPPARIEGLVLQVDMAPDSSRLSIRLNGSGVFSNRPAYVMVQNRSKLAYITKVQLQEGKAAFSVPVSKLSPGLCQVTVLDAQGIPLCERLTFIPETSAQIQVTIIAGKTSYKSRERVVLTLQANQENSPIIGFISVAVTDAQQVDVDTVAANIRGHLLLSGELRGQIEEPGYYFRGQSNQKGRELDDMLLTQGWRRLSWQPLSRPLTQLDTISGIRISGRVVDRKGQPVPNGKVLITARNAGRLLTQAINTTEQGRFIISGLMLPDTATLHIEAKDQFLRPINATIQLDNPGTSNLQVGPLPDANWNMLTKVLETGLSRQLAWPELYGQRKAKLLNEVVVKAKPLETRPEAIERASYVKPDVSLTFDAAARSKYSTVYQMIQGRVAGVRVSPKSTGGYSVQIGGPNTLTGEPSPPVYIIDGVVMEENSEGTTLLMLNPSEVERIEVLKYGNGAAYGARGGNGIIAIYTQKGEEPKGFKSNTEAKQFMVRGFALQREFYTSNYEGPELATVRDQRDVLYWKPIVQTDSNGQASLSFPLSDIAHQIRLNIQGISLDGQPITVEKTIIFDVNKE